MALVGAGGPSGFFGLSQGSYTSAPVPEGPSRSLLTPRTLSFFNVSMENANSPIGTPAQPTTHHNANINKWYDWPELRDRYAGKGPFYFYYRGDVFCCDTFAGESGNVQIHGIRVWVAVPGVGWTVAANRLPVHPSAFPSPADKLIHVTFVEDRPALLGCSSVAFDTTHVGAAYSLRKLDPSYSGPVVRVRRSTDDVETDLYASPAGVLLATITGQDYAAWLSASSPTARGYVRTWYDQSGAGNDAVMTTAARQPELVYEQSAQRYAIYFAGSAGSANTSRGLLLESPVFTSGISCTYNTQVDAWHTLVATATDQFGLRISDANYIQVTNAFTNFQTDFSSGAAGGRTFVNGYATLSTPHGQWNHVVATREPRLAMRMTHIGIPGNTSSFDDRALKGHMFEVILFKTRPSDPDADRLFENRPLSVNAELHEYPPAAIAPAPLLLPPGSINEAAQGMTITSSTNSVGREPAKAFDFNPASTWWSTAVNTYDVGTGAHIGAASTSTNVGARAGEWLQVALTMRARSLAGFDIFIGDINETKLRKYCIVGSNDGGTTWTMVHDQTASNVDLLCQRWHTVWLPSPSASFGTFRFIFSEFADNNVSNIAIHELRPIFTDMEYDCAASSTDGNRAAFLAFDNEGSSAMSWASAVGTYVVSTGTYAGVASTSAVHPATGSPVSIAGEWLQLSLPHATAINGFRINAASSIRKYAVVGTNDNATFHLVHSQDTNVDLATNADVNVHFVPLTGEQKFKTYRLIVRELINNGNGFIGITRWQLSTGGWRKDLADTVTGLGGAILPKYKAVVTSGTYGLGEYVAYANTIFGVANTVVYGPDEWPASGAFDKAGAFTFSRAGWHSAQPLPSSTDSEFPPWLVLKTPRAITVQQYSLTVQAQNLGQNQMPTKWEFQGSHDGSTWTTLDARSGIAWSGPSQTQTFVLPSNSTAFNHHRIVVYRVQVATTNLSIGELQLYALEGPAGKLLEFPPAAAGLPAGRSWTKDTNDTVARLGGGTLPKYKATASSGASGSLAYGDGEYVVWSNAVWGFGGPTELPPSAAFDKNFAANPEVAWASGPVGLTSGADVLDANAPYLAIKTPRAIGVRSYTINSHGMSGEDPSAWKFQGSTDGVNWKTLDTRSGVIFHYPASSMSRKKRFTIPLEEEEYPALYDHYRILVLRNLNGGGSVSIAELQLHATP